MPIKVFMPKLSPTMEKTGGKIVKWHVKEGDYLDIGDTLADIETDKTVMELDAQKAGTIGKIVAPEGQSGIKIGETIAIILLKGETQANIVDTESLCGLEKEKISDKNVSKSHNMPSGVWEQREDIEHKECDHIKSSPLAKAIASKNKINLATIVGSGPGGRIVKKDVNDYMEKLNQGASKSCADTESPGNLLPLSSIRSVIAERLTESKQTIPHFYLNLKCEVDQLMELRKLKNSNVDKKCSITINDFFIRAVALAIEDFPTINASWRNEGILLYTDIDVSIAVSIDEGLVTPVIRKANHKTLSDISSEVKNLAEKAKSKTLKLHEFSGGGITISTLGMFGISQFCAIINPPQSSILAIGKSEIEPYFDEKIGSFIPRNKVCLTLSVDHRLVDGVMGARFLNLIKYFIENPIKLFK